jgi:hypothetical protein
MPSKLKDFIVGYTKEREKDDPPGVGGFISQGIF